MILAGGSGSRFWPLSRSKRPKQFLSLAAEGESLLQATARRILPLVGESGVRVIANGSLIPLIRQHVPFAGIIEEPEARNTAACVGLAAVAALAEGAGDDPVLVVLPADHAVLDEVGLRTALSEAISVARSADVLVTIGIKPTHPHTGYGYVKMGSHLSGRAYRVDRFYEKPNAQRAEKYLEEGGFSWNSGMFVWRARVILEAFKSHLPEMYRGLMQIQNELTTSGAGVHQSRVADIFAEFESTSIDFGVLEHAKNCVVIDAAPFGWSDVGSWDQWSEVFESDTRGNCLDGDVLAIDSDNCVVKAHDRLVAAVGLKNIVIIDSGDALLVVHRDSVQDVRKVVAELKARGRNNLV